MNTTYEEYLAHHGVLGQKWGVRRYQNFDGTLTRAGLKRYEASKSSFEKSDDRYKKAKAAYKDAKKSGEIGKTKSELTNARLQRKKDERRLKKDYKHLKQDKLADKGKELYSKGKTITRNQYVSNALDTIGALTLAGAANAYKRGLIEPKVAGSLAAIGTASLVSADVKRLVDYSNNKKIRAYYAHTSKY